MKRLWIGVIFILLSHQSEASLQQCYNIFAVEKTETAQPQRQLTIWRYGGLDKAYPNEGFNVATVTTWKQSGTGYNIDLMGVAIGEQFMPMGSAREKAYFDHTEKLKNPALQELQTLAPGSHFLDKNQYFAMKQQQTTTIDPHQIQEQFKISHRLHPDQITFFEYTIVLREDEILKQWGHIPETARKDATTEAEKQMSPSSHRDQPPFYEVKEGSAWLISGQGRRGDFLSMPFEHVHFKTPYNRHRFKYAWELGRAAALTPKALGETLKAASYFALKELMVLGGEIQDAYIFVHSGTPFHTRLYKGIYKMEIFSLTDREGEAILIAPLQTLLDRSPPDKFSGPLEKTRMIFPDSETTKRMFALQKAHEYRNNFLENSNGSLITIRDFSPLPQILALAETKTEVSKPSIEALAGTPYFRTDEYMFQDNRNRTQFNNKNISIREFLDNYKAIEIEVLFSHKDSGSERQVLQSAVQYLFERMKNAGINHPAEFLKQQGIHIAFSFDHRNSHLVFEHIPPWIHQDVLPWSYKDYWHFTTYTENHTSIVNGKELTMQTLRPSQKLSIIYDLDSVMSNAVTASVDMKPFRGERHREMHLYFPQLYSLDQVQNRTEPQRLEIMLQKLFD